MMLVTVFILRQDFSSICLFVRYFILLRNGTQNTRKRRKIKQQKN